MSLLAKWTQLFRELFLQIPVILESGGRGSEMNWTCPINYSFIFFSPVFVSRKYVLKNLQSRSNFIISWLLVTLLVNFYNLVSRMINLKTLIEAHAPRHLNFHDHLYSLRLPVTTFHICQTFGPLSLEQFTDSLSIHTNIDRISRFFQATLFSYRTSKKGRLFYSVKEKEKKCVINGFQ